MGLRQEEEEMVVGTEAFFTRLCCSWCSTPALQEASAMGAVCWVHLASSSQMSTYPLPHQSPGFVILTRPLPACSFQPLPSLPLS